MQNHPDRPSLCQELLKKIPDLRTLNTLHSEKLLAFKMTEQQNQLDQQQQQHQDIKIEPQNGGVWSMMMNGDDFNRKSPEEAGSSSWSDETTSIEDMKSLVMLDEVKSPLGSVSSTESVCSDEYHHHHHGPSKHAASAPLLAATLAGAVCPIRRHAVTPSDEQHLLQLHQVIVRPTSCRYQRKQDSPTDSGIESGTEKLDRPAAPHSAPTSICSSPRSTVEDAMMMMTAAADSLQNPAPQAAIEDMPVLKRVLQAPPLYDTNSLMDEAYKPHKKFRALRGAKDSAEAEAVRPVSAAAALLHHSPQLHHHLTSSSLLSSTHSTLAKSLRETPKMTAEQIKRTEVIHNFIMREDTTGGTTNSTTTSTSCNSYQQQQQQTPPTRWHTPVITSASAQNSSRLSSPPPPPTTCRYAAAVSSGGCTSSGGVLARVLSPPSSSSSSVSPLPSVRRTPSPNVVNLQVGITNAAAEAAAAAHSQPLNLSKKLSPSPTPTSIVGNGANTPPPPAPAQVAMEA